MANLQPARFDDDELIAQFVFDFCCKSADRRISRGYLDGLESLILSLGPDSDLSEAVAVASLASIGLRSVRPDMLRHAKARYVSLLGRFRAALLDHIRFDRSLMTVIATILGLYELIVADETLSRAHNSHIKGISAILTEPGSPFDINRALRSFSLANALPLHSGPQQCPPAAHALQKGLNHDPFRSTIEDLDELLLKISPLQQKAQALLNSSDKDLEALSLALAQIREIGYGLQLWSSQKKPAGWQPFRSCYNWHGEGIEETLSHQGQTADSYYDLYVAAVWNTYRKCHMLMLDLEHNAVLRLLNTSIPLPTANTCLAQCQQDAEELAESIISSIPFHLQPFAATGRSERTHSYRPVGGLLLIHPLLVISRCSILDTRLRKQARDILRWIGSNMGIGEAIVLSHGDDPVPFEDAACGHVLIWSGMMI